MTLGLAEDSDNTKRTNHERNLKIKKYINWTSSKLKPYDLWKKLRKWKDTGYINISKYIFDERRVPRVHKDLFQLNMTTRHKMCKTKIQDCQSHEKQGNTVLVS